MTVLADHQIRELCVPSSHRFDQNKFDEACKKYDFAWMAQDVLGASSTQITEILQGGAPRREDFMIKLTEEQRLSFVPMIENFVNGQVRVLEEPPENMTRDSIRVLLERGEKDDVLHYYLVNNAEVEECLASLNANKAYDDHQHSNIRESLRKRFSTKITRAEAQLMVPGADLDTHNNSYPVKAKLISYGLTSFGYDVRLDDSEFVIFTNHQNGVIDPKKANPKKDTMPLEIHTDRHGCKYVVMPAHTYGMGFTKEYFNVPRNVNIVCLGKSTYARSSVFVNVTPIEAGFKGNVVIELGNCTGSPVKVYLNEGIAQFQFQQGVDCEVSYGDRNGKYQGQRGLTHARV